MNVKAGGFHTLIQKTDGTLWAFGKNSHGQLGILGTSSDFRPFPGQLPFSNVLAFSAGYDHTFVLKSDGTLWASGNNEYGKLGNGSVTTPASPVRVAEGVKEVAAGKYHTVVLKSDDTLWAFGSNNSYQLGQKTVSERSEPHRIMENIRQVSAGRGFSLIVKEDDTLWGFGKNNYGQLGNGTTLSSSSPVKIMDGISSVSAGSNHAMALKSDNSLWAFGYNYHGQTGNGQSGSGADLLNPRRIMNSIKAVSAGGTHTMIMKTDGTLWGFGDGEEGQLGSGVREGSLVPVKPDLNATTYSLVADVAAGATHTVVRQKDGTLRTWGENSFGALGINSNMTFHPTPVVPKSATGAYFSGVKAVYAGDGYTMALKDDNTLWAFGNNLYGRLGDGSTMARRHPVEIMADVKEVSLGSYHSLILKTDGTLWSCGNNGHGRLGNRESGTQVLSPVQVMDNVKSVSAGYDHSLVVKNDSSLWVFGNNEYGQLGDGSVLMSADPCKISASLF